jgi:hypothetical protein
MKGALRYLAAAVTLAAVSAPPAAAQAVQYSTLYSFTGLPGSYSALTSNIFTSATGTATLTFTGQPVTLVTAPSFIDYGTVAVTGAQGTFNFTGQQVFLEILQTLPTTGNAVVVGALSGAITGNTQSNAIINWNSPSRFATIDGTTYELERLGSGFTSINAETTGPQTIRGYVSTTTTPEPASMTLLATGLAGVFGAVRRKRKG